MATLNEHISVLEAILNDISDGSDRNFINILSANECQQRNNDEQFKTNKTPNEINLFTNKLVGHVTEAAGVDDVPKASVFSLARHVDYVNVCNDAASRENNPSSRRESFTLDGRWLCDHVVKFVRWQHLYAGQGSLCLAQLDIKVFFWNQ